MRAPQRPRARIATADDAEPARPLQPAAIRVYREHTSRILSLERPASAAALATAIGQAETSKLRALDRVRRSAGALDVPGARKEIRDFTTIARNAAPRLVELDVPECARYE